MRRAVSPDRPTSAGGGERLRIGYLPITDAAPLLIAERGAADLAEPVLFRSWAALAEAFRTRQVDIVHLLMPMAVQLRFGLGAADRSANTVQLVVMSPSDMVCWSAC